MMKLGRLPFQAAWLAAFWLGLGVVGTSVSGCKNARFPNMISKEQEIDLGQQGSSEVDKELRGKFITSGPQYNQLQRVAAKIFPLAKADWDVPYTIKLVDSKEINAFAMPGGPIYFYKGLMDLASSDDEVASVLGHEASHIVKRHSAKQISDAMVKQFGASILLGGASQMAQMAAGLALQIDQLQYSRSDEAQADEFGFKYLVNAGYDPDAMASFFRKMEQKAGSGGGTPEFLRSHPVTSKRVEEAQKRATEYKQGRGSNN
jgi:beta-barrel assembly-enhancing protease